MFLFAGAMTKITGIKYEKGGGKRVRLYLDGKPALKLEAELAAEKGLKAGSELSQNELSEIESQERYRECMNVALKFLAYRPRSEHEVRDKLRLRGFQGSDIDKVIDKLKEQKYIDDAAFAEYWRENRTSFSPRSRRMLASELVRKGVKGADIDVAVSDIDEAENAYRAALPRARRLSLADREGFRERLGGYLRRRGFSYDVINNTLERIWRELKDEKA